MFGEQEAAAAVLKDDDSPDRLAIVKTPSSVGHEHGGSAGERRDLVSRS